MSNFEESFQDVIGLEGSYSFDVNDAGGETKYGISKRSYPSVDIKHLTLEEAKNIYWRDYWNRMLLAQILDGQVATEIFEQGVNFGPGTAVRHAQMAVGMIDAPVVTDGVMGTQTLAAINRLGQRRRLPFLKVMNGLQFKRYWEIVDNDPSQKRFFVGWLRRVGETAA